MSKSQWKVATIACAISGTVLLAIGLILGLMPISKNGVSCGSPFNPSGNGEVADLTNSMSGISMATSYGADCADSTANRKPIAWILLIAGAAGGFGGALTCASLGSADTKRRTERVSRTEAGIS